MMKKEEDKREIKTYIQSNALKPSLGNSPLSSRNASITFLARRKSDSQTAAAREDPHLACATPLRNHVQRRRAVRSANCGDVEVSVKHEEKGDCLISL